MNLSFTVNGEKRNLIVSPDDRLIDILREDFGLTGTKEGCSEGECGACTVLMDGEPIVSCLVLAPQVQGHHITTIEGIGEIDHLGVIQNCFVEEGAVQCGYCSSGMIISIVALLSKNTSPSEEEIRLAISGNLCRCSGYTQIIRAAKKAAEIIRKMDSANECTHSQE